MKYILTLLLGFNLTEICAQSSTDTLASKNDIAISYEGTQYESIVLFCSCCLVLLILAIIIRGKKRKRKVVTGQAASNLSKAQERVKTTAKTNTINDRYKKGTESELPEMPAFNNSSSINISDQVEVIIPEIETTPSVKYIGYNPINIFNQTDSFSYPYVVMPKPKSVIKFPRKGRTGRKGYKEDSFYNLVQSIFKTFKVYNDRYITLKDGNCRHEPDITMIDESNGRNLFINIEIDEPYEGTNNVETRKLTHLVGSDHKRDHNFTSRGWIVIRFSEEQIHNHPKSCLLYISDVIKSLISEYPISDFFTNTTELTPCPFWDLKIARRMSYIKYRETYLGIEHFGSVSDQKKLEHIKETVIEKKTEEEVVDDYKPIKAKTVNSSSEIIRNAITNDQYLICTGLTDKFICKPFTVEESSFIGFCYVRNKKVRFSYNDLSSIHPVDNYVLHKRKKVGITDDKITSLVKIAIQNNKYLRMTYTKSTFGRSFEEIDDLTSVRTICNVTRALDFLDSEHINRYNLGDQHISAYCYLRSENRTFNFNRIQEVEILNL